jgi:hypothetical protein
MLAGLGAVIVVAVALISVWVPAMAGSKIKPRDQMVFTHDNRQYLISLNGGAARQLNLAFTHTKARRSARVKIPTVFTYEWAPDGRYLLSQMSGANQAIGLWSAAGRLLRNLTRRSNANAPLGWATDRDEIVYLTQGSPRHFVCKKRHCPPVTWTVVNSLTAAGKSSQVWPRKRPPTSTTGGFNVGALSVRQFDPAHALLGAELNDNAPTVTWSANRNIVMYPDLYGGSVLQPWRVLDIRTGGHWLLPFGFTSARTARERSNPLCRSDLRWFYLAGECLPVQ